MDKFKLAILKEIKKIKPKPRLVFTMQNIFWWALFVFFTLFWAFAFQIVLFLIFWSDWNTYEHVYSSKTIFLLNIFPYFWLLVFLLFLSLAFIYTKYTKNAYKIWYLKIILTNSILSIFIWWLLFYCWVSYWNLFEDKWLLWKEIQSRFESRWMNPGRWRLIWKIQKVWRDWFDLKDIRWFEWRVNKPFVKWKNDHELLVAWKDVRVAWKLEFKNVFKAKVIVPGCIKGFKDRKMKAKRFKKAWK